MKTENIERYLNSFGKQIVNRAKSNLQKSKGGGTNLEKSLSFKIVKDADGFTVEFYMAEYGTFVDKGVSGNKQQRSFKDYKNKVVKSPYKYTNKQPPPNILAKWISKKGIKGRDKKTGRFISHMSLAFIFGRKIKRDGIQGISFFQKPMALGLKQFGKNLLNNIKEDVMKGLTTVK